MTRQKNKTAIQLQSEFLKLSAKEQAGVTNFFNLHNAAHYVYEGLSEDAQSYITYCIKLNANALKKEENNSAQDA